MKHIGVALLGLGVVGGGTYQILLSKRESIKETEGVDIEVKAILERDLDKCKKLGVDMSIVTQDIEDIVNNDEIQIVAEFFGGVEPARSFLTMALEKGKSVVTANKEMLAKSWHILEKVAKKSGAGIYFEASCVGGVPVIRAIQESMQANKITSLKGIVNGTTNYILTKMSNENLEYDVCLKQAQELGYAEANPTADVDGFDSMYKNSILSSLAYRTRVPIENIYREGISNIQPKDIAIAKALGYTLKLLAISKCNDGKIECRVHPAFLKNDNPLAMVNGVFNALLMHGDNVDDVMLYGRGAGALPTGSAIVSDIVYASSKSEHRHFEWEVEEGNTCFVKDFLSAYYMRISIDNGGENALANISKLLAMNNVKIEYISQNSAQNEIVLVSGVTHESVKDELVEGICALANVKEVCAVIRVENN